MRWSFALRLVGSLALGLGASAMLTGCSRSGGEEDPVRAESQVPVRLARVETREFNDRIDAPGNVHEFTLQSACADMDIRIVGKPSPDNPKTSMSTAYTVAREIINRLSAIAI